MTVTPYDKPPARTHMPVFCSPERLETCLHWNHGVAGDRFQKETGFCFSGTRSAVLNSAPHPTPRGHWPMSEAILGCHSWEGGFLIGI